MKQRSFFYMGLLLMLGLSACGGGGSSSGTTPAATPFPFGEPTGPAVTQTIGPAGGTLDPGDGTVRLTFPAGALTQDTAISIQPVAITAPGGRVAYRLSPSGLTFARPFQITFSFTDADLLGSSPRTLGIGFQDDQGFWYALRDTVRDEAAKTITTTSTHFSDWSYFIGWRIDPSEAIVAAGSRISLVVENCEPRTVADAPSTAMTSCSTDYEAVDLIKEWAVDGIEGGNAAIGTVTTELVPSAVYTAPVFVVGAETHEVSARLSRPNVPDELLISRITVVPGGSGAAAAYSVRGDLDLRGILIDLCPQSFGYISKPHLTDQVNFLIVPNQNGSGYSIVNIGNGTSTFEWVPRPAQNGSGGTARMDSDPEWITMTSGTATDLAPTIAVDLSGSRRTGGCTFFNGQGAVQDQLSPVERPAEVDFSFSVRDFDFNGQQTVITDLSVPGTDIFGDPVMIGQWTWVISIVPAGN